MAKRKVNIKDVAARAEVHPSTVSRVMNPETRSMVSERVAERVTRIAGEMGYTRSPLASGLRTGRSFTIGVIIPDLSNPMFPPIVRGIERTLEAEGYIAILADSDNSQKSERAIFDSMKSRRIDGLILATAHIEDPIVEDCIEEQLPVVLVNRTIDTHDVSEVINNDELGIQLAVSHLIELGHKQIAFLGGPQNISTGRDRYRAFRNLADNGQFELDPDLCASCTAFTEAAGHTSMLGILDCNKPFSAVVAANDLLALGCYDALEERGVSCPGDVSVTGFNNMPFVDRFSPPLTSLHIPHDELGVRAANLLLAEIRNSDAPRTTIRLDPVLVVRGSTAAPGQAS
ncbi:MAG: LacI family DNA-binding transcriptional regulator [Proteobacteria bacterium]|nr:LacI family DNA-binding transcriptional regulator [Pseudomonadota bacterium]